MEDVNKPLDLELFFPFLNLELWNSTLGELAYIWQSKWVKIIVMKIERPLIHFLNNVIIHYKEL